MKCGHVSADGDVAGIYPFASVLLRPFFHVSSPSGLEGHEVDLKQMLRFL